MHCSSPVHIFREYHRTYPHAGVAALIAVLLAVSNLDVSKILYFCVDFGTKDAGRLRLFPTKIFRSLRKIIVGEMIDNYIIICFYEFAVSFTAKFYSKVKGWL